MKKVLITGANSYIGMSFETYAKENYVNDFEIDTVDMQNPSWRELDFSKYDVVFHVAGIAHADVGNVSEEVKKKYYAVNTDLTIETAKKAKLNGVKQFIFMSSMIIYGESAPYGKSKVITTDTKPKPANFYGDSKLQADIGVRKLQDEKFTVSVVRPPMIYGKGSRGNYPILAKLAKTLPLFPSVDNQRSMLYIGNLCEFLCQIMLLQKGGIFFPQNSEYTKTSDMVKNIAKVTGKKICITNLLNPFVWLASKVPGKISGLVNKAFGNSCYDLTMSVCEEIDYQKFNLHESIMATEGNNEKRALIYASVASMIDQFNRDNIRILQNEGYEVDVAANFSFGSTTSQERVNLCKKELEEKGVTVYDVSLPRSLFRIIDIWKAYIQSKKIIDQGNYTIVHCHSPIGGVICRLACRRSRKVGTKLIYTAHGFHFYEGAPLLNWLMYFPIEFILSSWTDLLITINEEDYQRAKKFFKTKEIKYVPGIGIDTQRFGELHINKQKKKEELGLGKDDVVLLSVGELNDNKNHEVVIKALRELKDSKLHYLVAGQGVLYEKLRNLAIELEVDNQVHILGFRTDVEELLQMADIYIFPSKREGLSVALMEAMAAGLPIICSKIRGNVDLIKHGENGYLCDCKDVHAFSNAIKEIQCDEANIFGNKNREKILKCDIKQVRNMMKQIYCSIIK